MRNKPILTILLISVFTITIIFFATRKTILGDLTASNRSCPILTDEQIIKIDTSKTGTFAGSNGDLKLEAGQYALTFDDGPMLYVTPAIVNVLQEKCVPATFFMVGVQAQVLFPIVELVKNAGFNIGTHTYFHRKLTELPIADAKREVASGIEAVETSMQGLPQGAGRLFRFPHWKSDEDILAYIRSVGATAINADISPEDWRGLPATETFKIFQERLEKTDRGVIVLHDRHINTVEVLPMIIDEVLKRGGRFVQLTAVHDTPLEPLTK